MRLLPLLTIAALFSGCGRHSAPASAPATVPISVRTARVVSATLPLTQTLTATVHPVERATVSARVMGSVTGATFAVGQSVRAGELLLTLTAAELPARAEQARAALAQAQREFARDTALVAQSATAADTALAADDRRHLAQAAVAEAEALLTYTRVAAPFAGTITQKFVNTGDLAVPGTPLFTLEATNHLRAELQVPESFAPLPLGTAIAVVLAPDAAPITATLAEFSTAADPVTRTRLAKLDLPAASAARSGQFVRVLWPAGETTALLVPASTLSVLGQMERVFVVAADHRAQLRLVKTGARSGSNLEILAGLTAGESVVLDPASTLRDGQPVTAAP